MEIKMTAREAYKRFWTQAFVLNQRARRKEFWVPFIIHMTIAAAGLLLAVLISPRYPDALLFNLQLISDTVLVIPFFSVLFRRLQDLNITGWTALPVFIFTALFNATEFMTLDDTADGAVVFCYAIVSILFFIVLAFDGTEGPNKYGHDPKEVIDELNPRQ
ncbi:DUF805 domain-containing protein [Macrococcus equipercicus]|uniref:DUF805 domain-containing protein n=1 Tax=Macrococcus equipercicus TaxID=69967 RepID=A0A9Q9BUB1_9STAP|nr:DUF805 domain-containing protein [Macrococcus equipercicus]UTH14226.1 DUF805 domain-containing protein [Macrococcus equipercicus]